MTPSALLADLHQRGIELTVDGSQLRYRAPKGALTPKLREALSQQKAEILAALKNQQETPLHTIHTIHTNPAAGNSVYSVNSVQGGGGSVFPGKDPVAGSPEALDAQREAQAAAWLRTKLADGAGRRVADLTGEWCGGKSVYYQRGGVWRYEGGRDGAGDHFISDLMTARWIAGVEAYHAGNWWWWRLKDEHATRPALPGSQAVSPEAWDLDPWLAEAHPFLWQTIVELENDLAQMAQYQETGERYAEKFGEQLSLLMQASILIRRREQRLAHTAWDACLIRSSVLNGALVWLVQDEKRAQEGMEDDKAAFFADEVELLKGKTPDQLRNIHDVKLVFPGARIVPDLAGKESNQEGRIDKAA